MIPMRRKVPLVCQLSRLLPAFCLFGFSLLLLAQGEWTSPDHIGLVQDWSTHHAVFPRNGPLSAMLAAQHDPRHVRMKRVDFAQRPLVEGLRDHDVDEVQDLHATYGGHLLRLGS